MHSHDTIPEPNPSGLCMCGCGQRTSLATQTSTKHGYVRGRPMRYVIGHHWRGHRKPDPYIVDPVSGCWVWQHKITHGYAYVTHGRKTVRAARYFYEQHVGPIPDGMTIDHTCRNRACVNPAHLEPVTLVENVRRKPATKLTVNDADTIRELVRTISQSEIAKRFGVHQSSISRIVHGKTWR